MDHVASYYEYLHVIPELSGEEKETSQYVSETLKKMGYVPHPVGKYGVYADLVSDPEAPWILFRADMDALAIEEPRNHSLKSAHPGVMHACGHDAHTSMLLAAAEKLKKEEKNLPQNIRFLFQPAEENTQGAHQMVDSGILQPAMSAAFAMHVWPQVPKGSLAVKTGAMMASSDVFLITCTGRGIHCAQRSKGADALQTAVEIAESLPEIEKLAEGDGTMLFCGSIHSGTAHNIVPDKSTVYGTLRSYSEPHRCKIKEKLTEQAEMCGKRHGVKVEIQWSGACPVLRNDEELIERLSEILPNLSADAEPTLASEDFAYYQQQCPGVLMWLGAGDIAPLHTGEFQVPEEILPLGVEAWLRIARNPWGREAGQRKRNPEYTKRLILDAAEEEFAEKGLFGARVDSIALRAGVNKRMIYAYYGDKEQLYRFVLSHVYSRMGSIEQPIVDAGYQGKELIHQIITVYFDFLHRDPHFVNLLMWENLNHGKYLAEIEDDKIRRKSTLYFMRQLEEGKKNGIFREEIDPKQTVISLITSCFANFSNQFTLSKLFGENLGSDEMMEQRKQHTIQMITAYLCRN